MSSKKRNMSCNKPVKSWRPGKKRAVKACSGGKEKIIHYGATGYGHNYSSAARNSFRARHKCSAAKNILTARYWACKDLWTKGGSVQSCPSNRKCKYVRRNSIRRNSIRKSRRRRSIRSIRSTSHFSLSRPRRSRRKSVRKSRRRISR